MRIEANNTKCNITENMLSTALGAATAEFLMDESIVEIMLNPDGKLWVDELGQGRRFTGHTIDAVHAERAIFATASSVGAICNAQNPILSAELPGTGSRFQGMLPPVVSAPIFTIRKKALKVFSLRNYVENEILTNEHSIIIQNAITAQQNILIVGGTGSGKTTLANAVLNDIAKLQQRLVIIEDTLELQCTAPDTIRLRTVDSVANMTELLKATMRLRPDRIIIGEVRGAEAHTLLKAWNTGHPGGCATIHADSARKALSRLEQLVLEAGVSVSKQLIAETINLVVFIEKTNAARKISELVEVNWQNNDYFFKDL